MKAPLRVYTIGGPARALVSLETREFVTHYDTMDGVWSAGELATDGFDQLLTRDEAKAACAAIAVRNDKRGLDDQVSVRTWGDIPAEEL